MRCEMYNEERKVQFIQECGLEAQRALWVATTFNNTGLMEEELGKDLAELTAEEVGDALATTGIVSSMTIGNRIPLVVRYKNWCAEKGFPTVIVKTSEIRVDISDNIRDSMVYSASQLAGLLQLAFPDTSKKSVKCIYRAYLWMGFAGMQQVDAASVRVSDVDLKSGMIHFQNRWYTIPHEGMHDLRKVCKETEFVRIMRGKEVVFRREEGDRILRGNRLKKQATVQSYVRDTLRSTVQAGFKNIGHDGMSFLRIRKSGIFCEMFGREVHGLAVNFAPVAHDDYLAGDHVESKANPKQKVVRRIMLAYERDYAAWKNAYSDELMELYGLHEMPAQP